MNIAHEIDFTVTLSLDVYQTWVGKVLKIANINISNFAEETKSIQKFLQKVKFQIFT